MPALSPLLTIMTRAAEKASKSLLRDFGEVEQLQVSVKGPGDFVTAADRRAEQILYQELSKSRPAFSFLMEESGEVGNKNAEARWIIDPLDGTLNFLHGIPHWAISVALEQAGEIVAGIVFDPVKNEMFMAEKGGGAFSGKKRLRVSGRRDLKMCLAAYWSAQNGRLDDKIYYGDLTKLRSTVANFRCNGASALDMAYVSAGRYDMFYQQDVKSWDIAAGILLVKEAGGDVAGFGKSTDPIHSGGILATNGALMAPLKELLGVK